MNSIFYSGLNFVLFQMYLLAVNCSFLALVKGSWALSEKSLRVLLSQASLTSVLFFSTDRNLLSLQGAESGRRWGEIGLSLLPLSLPPPPLSGDMKLWWNSARWGLVYL